MKWESYQTTKKIRIWCVLNLFRLLWKLANENLSYIMLSHDTTIVLSHAFNSHSLCFCCLALASLPSKPFHYSLIELQILQRQVSHHLLLCWQFNLKVCLILPPVMNHSLTDAIFSGDFGIIFNSFCFNNNLSLNVRLYDVQRALVMTTTWLEVNDCKHEIVWYTLRMRILLSLPLKGQLNLC